MKSPILHSKLHQPGPRETLLPRRRLFAHLDAARRAQHPLLLLSAPAGSGKTTLLADWIRRREVACAWLSLDADDNDVVRFGRYFMAALAPLLDTAACEHLVDEVLLPDPASFWLHLADLLSTADSPLLIVLDDYHLIQSPSIHAGLQFLIEHLPATMHLVLATRSDPPFPLARWRVRGEMSEIRKDDLQFSRDETHTFLTTLMGLPLAENVITALQQRTEGWIAGLQLAAISLRKHPDPDAFLAGFTGSHRFVLDYLSEEVLHQQDAQTRRFLLQTAILDRFDADLCAAVTGEAESPMLLDRLFRENLFLVPLDDAGQSYRYHHLFAELLRVHLQQDAAFDVPGLHRRAADWYVAHGDTLPALQHYLAGAQHQHVADLVEAEAFPLFNQGNFPAVLDLIQRLPAEIIRQRPWLNAYQGFFLTLSGQVQAGDNALRLAEQAADDPDLIGFVAATRVHVRSARLELQQAEVLARLALAKISDEHSFLRCYASYGLGKVLIELDRLSEATDVLVQALAISEAQRHLVNILPVLNLLAQIALEQDDLAGADQYLQRAEHYTERHRAATTRMAAFWQVTRAHWLQAQGQREAALALAEQATERSQKHQNVFTTIHCLLTQADILDTLGDASVAGERLDQARALQQQYPVFRDLAALICLQEARHALRQGDSLAATEQLQDCDPGESRRIARQKQAVQAQLRAAQPAPSAVPTHPALVEQLSPREFEVLQLIAQGMANAEIAATLFVSLSTIKKHSRNIFGKLEATNRTQAVRRARELELLE